MVRTWSQEVPKGASRIDLGRNSLKRLERAKGIEPSYEAWEASVLPLNYARRPRIVAPAVRHFNPELQLLPLTLPALRR